MKTNCLIFAWQEYIKDKRIWIAYRRSDFSSLEGKMPFPVRVIGWVFIYPASIIWLIAHYLIFGTWPHYAVCTNLCHKCTELIPQDTKERRVSPPLIFTGRKQIMPYSNNLRAEDVEETLERAARLILNTLARAQEDYQDLLEAYAYAGGTATGFARVIYNTASPTEDQLAFVTDAIAAGQAINSVNTTVNNNAQALRRFS